MEGGLGTGTIKVPWDERLKELLGEWLKKEQKKGNGERRKQSRLLLVVPWFKKQGQDRSFFLLLVWAGHDSPRPGSLLEIFLDCPCRPADGCTFSK